MITTESFRVFGEKSSFFAHSYAFFSSLLVPPTMKNITKSQKSRKNRYVLETFFRGTGAGAGTGTGVLNIIVNVYLIVEFIYVTCNFFITFAA